MGSKMRFVWERAVGLRREKKRRVGMEMCLEDGRRRLEDIRRFILVVGLAVKLILVWKGLVVCGFWSEYGLVFGVNDSLE
jgi:hypothetical protein